MTFETVVVVVGFALPFVLLVAGLLALGAAMPSVRDTPTRSAWTVPGTIVIIAAGVTVLLLLLSFRGDGDSSIWTDSGAGGHIAIGGALTLAVLAAAAQGWVAVGRGGAVTGHMRSIGMGLAGIAMLALFAAIILAVITELR